MTNRHSELERSAMLLMGQPTMNGDFPKVFLYFSMFTRGYHVALPPKILRKAAAAPKAAAPKRKAPVPAAPGSDSEIEPWRVTLAEQPRSLWWFDGISWWFHWILWWFNWMLWWFNRIYSLFAKKRIGKIHHAIIINWKTHCVDWAIFKGKLAMLDYQRVPE